MSKTHEPKLGLGYRCVTLCGREMHHVEIAPMGKLPTCKSCEKKSRHK